MYYVMEQETDLESCFILTQIPNLEPEAPWFDGDPLAVNPATPIEFLMNSKYGSTMPDFFDAGVPVFSSKLYQAFLESGVDNLEAFDAVMVNPDTGERWADYLAINVVGKIRCADMEKSTYRDPTGSGLVTVFFQDLVVSDKLASEALCFRLAESLGEIIVHEKVVKLVESRKCRNVKFDRASLDPDA